MQKFFVESNQIDGSKVVLDGADFNHIVNVLRMKKGESLQIGDKENQNTYLAEIAEIKTDIVILNIVQELDESTESNIRIDLYQGLPKFDKMELIIQKTTEIGINSITPIDLSRCIVKLDEKDSKKKIERWQKIAEMASKQSKRGKIPEIHNKLKFKEIEEKIKEYDAFFVAFEEEKENDLKKELKKLKSKEQYKIGILIGPEGGITKEEIEQLEKWKAKVITLGKRILRTETAPIVMCANIIYELE